VKNLVSKFALSNATCGATPRHESRGTVFGYSLACVASFIYCVNRLGEDGEDMGGREGVGGGGSGSVGKGGEGVGGGGSGGVGGGGRGGGAAAAAAEGAPLLRPEAGGVGTGAGADIGKISSSRKKGGSDGYANVRSLLIGLAIAAAIGVNFYFLFVSPDEALEAAAAAAVTQAAEHVIQNAAGRVGGTFHRVILKSKHGSTGDSRYGPCN
jgi:hypothetical protein